MKYRAWSLLVGLILVLAIPPAVYLYACGVERWSVKVGTDADIGLVNVSSPTPTTIAALRAFATPNPIPANNRVSPQETTLWVVNATLTTYKSEDDQDYHLVLQDAGGLTMIAEIPDPTCASTSSLFSAIQNARSQFDARFNATSSFQTANIPVQITGIGMHDFLHGQTGVAPNGIELHPVTNIVFNPSAADFAIATSPTTRSVVQGGSGTTSITTTTSGSFSSAVALSASGLPTGTSASFSPALIAAPGSGSSTMTLNVGGSTATGTYNVSATGVGGGKTRSATIALTVTPAATPNFSIGASPTSVSVDPGSSAPTTVTVSSVNGFNASTSLTASGLPAGVSASFAPTSVTPPANGGATSTLTFQASAGATAGTSTVTLTGTSGALTRTTTVALSVNAPSGGNAVYDPTLKAPKCSAVGSSCDSGTLLNGRATLGPEANQPNTINSSCADGTSGTFHSDESNERLKIATTDGTPFAAGKTVTVTATVWAYSTPSSDFLELYFAANAANPTWVLIGTVQPTAAGVQTLSRTYTLPSGALQAVRANFRYTGSASSCSTGAYDDHDDLVFAVGAGAGDTTPPTTAITAPAGGAIVSGSAVNVTASASDNSGTVSRVEFYIDGTLKSTSTTAPYASAWDTTGYANGSHTIQSKAYDPSGNVGSSATVTVTVSNTSTPQQLLLNPGFESGNVTWTATSGVIDNSTSEAAHTGTWKAWLDGYGSAHTDSLYQQIAIPSSSTSATLSFWLHIDSAETTTTTAFDTLQVQIRNSSGTVLQTLATYSNLDAASGYAQKSFDVLAYKGQTIRVYFLGTEGGINQTSFVVDDAALTVQ